MCAQFSAEGSNVDVGLKSLSPFDIKSSTVLVTGGGSGIGFAIVEELIGLGVKTVLISGRREDVLKQVQTKYPQNIHYLVSDAGSETDRIKLFQWATEKFPHINVLINNAGVQRQMSTVAEVKSNTPWSERAAEIRINVDGPIHLSELFLPHFLSLSQKEVESAIIQITSGLAYVNMPAAPVYSATKFALHSYTLSLRYALANTKVRVVEIAPPAVKSNLGGSHDFGEDPKEFTQSVIKRFLGGEVEIGYKMSEKARTSDRKWLAEFANNLAKLHVPQF